jgi:hypothetical protein
MQDQGPDSDTYSFNPVNTPVDNAIAAIWSMMLPGLGQLLKGEVMGGIFWAFLVGFGYFAFFWPGLIFHSLCILDAAFHHGNSSWLKGRSLVKKILFGCMIILLLIYIVIRNF